MLGQLRLVLPIDKRTATAAWQRGHQADSMGPFYLVLATFKKSKFLGIDSSGISKRSSGTSS